MNRTSYFLLLLEQVFRPLWWIVLPVLLLASLLAVLAHRDGRMKTKRFLVGVSAVSLPMLIVLWGYLREHTSEHWAGELPQFAGWEITVLHLLAGISVVNILVLLRRSKGCRLCALTWASVLGWWTFLAWFAASMSISGDWI